MQAKNLAELYQEAGRHYKGQPAFLSRENAGKFSGPDFQELYNMGVELATGLIDLGVRPREHVGLLADNCLEWILSDYAVQLCAAADVPRGTDVTDFDINYILNHSDARIIFVENEKILNRLLKNKTELPNLSCIILMAKDSPPKGRANIFHLYDLMKKGKELRAKGDQRVEERIGQIQPDDLFTLIYTSGTTGVPKGVMLTHANIMSQIRNVPFELKERERVLSVLPVWHIFERLFELVCISKGAATYYTNIRSIREDMQLVRPTFMASAPRLWENVYLGIMKKVEGGASLPRALFRMAYFYARMYKASLRFLTFKQLDLDGRSILVSLFLRSPLHLLRLLLFYLPYRLLDFIVLAKIRAATGGQLRFSVSGGGALPLHVDIFFNNIGIPVLEGYGMTETSPVLSVRTPSDLIIGSVGKLWPETQLRLVDTGSGETIYPPAKGRQGEIHVKGPQVMKGYYKNQEATDKVLKDGWMNTGDLGMLTYNNALKIVGRSKETVVLLGGENIEPVPIENKLLQSDLIEHCMITGQDKKHLTCLVVPNVEALKQYGSDHVAVATHADAHALLQKEIKSMVSTQNGFKSYEKIIDCRLLPKPFTVGEELTSIFKLKRHVVTENYKDLIESMYY